MVFLKSSSFEAQIPSSEWLFECAFKSTLKEDDFKNVTLHIFARESSDFILSQCPLNGNLQTQNYKLYHISDHNREEVGFTLRD